MTNLVYLIWASGEVQPFNMPHLINSTDAEVGASTSGATKGQKEEQKP